MKDAYFLPFCDGASLAATVSEMESGLPAHFQRCGLRAVAVEADSGAIGGSASQEFMVTAEVGEGPDPLQRRWPLWPPTRKRAVSLESEAIPLEPSRDPGPFRPRRRIDRALCRRGCLSSPARFVKVLLLLARFAGPGPPRPVLVCAARVKQLNEVEAQNALTKRLAVAQGIP